MITIEDTLAAMDKDASTLKDVSIDGKKSSLKSVVFSQDRFIDADTFIKDNVKYRDYGINQPEVTRFDPVTGTIKFGENQGASVLAPQALSEMGYNTGITKGRDSTPSRRVLLERQNQVGDKAQDFLVRNFLAPVSKETTPEASNQRLSNAANAEVFPSVLERNPYLRAGLKVKEEELAAAKAGNYPPVLPKVTAANPEELAGFKAMYSNKGIANLTDNIKDLQDTIAMHERAKDPTQKGFTDYALTDSAIAEKRKELLEAQIRLQQVTNMQNFYNTSFIKFNKNDRNIDNQMHDNYYLDSLYQGGLKTAQWGAGVAAMTGDAYEKYFGSKPNQDAFTKADPEAKLNYLSKAGRRAWSNAQIMLDAEGSVGGNDTIMETFNSGKSTWGKLSAVTNTVASSIVGSLPTMVAVAGMGGPFAGASTIIPGTLLFAGKNYGAQPEGKKDMALAIGTGTFEQLAEQLELKGMFGGTSALNNIFASGSRAKLAEAMVQTGRAATKEAALIDIEQRTKKELLALADYSHDFAKKQYLSKEALLRGSLYAVENSAIQSSQEMTQEYMELLGSAGKRNFTPENEAGFSRTMLNAGLGGLGFSASFMAPRMITNTAQWHAIDSGLKNYEGNISDAQQYQSDNNQRLKTNNGGFVSAEQAASQIRNSNFNLNDEHATDDLYKLPASRGLASVGRSLLSPFTTFMGRQIDKMFPSITDENGNSKYYLGALKAMYAGDGILPGASFHRFVQNLIGDTVKTDGTTLAGKLNINKNLLDTYIKDAVTTWKQGAYLNQNTGDDKQNLINKELNKWWVEQQEAVNTLRSQADSVGGVASRVLLDPTSLLDSNLVDLKQWNKNKAFILDELSKANPSEHLHEISKAVNNLVSGNREKAELAKDYLAGLGMFNNPSLSQFFESNILDNVQSVKSRLARDIGVAKYFGKNGEVLAKGLSKAWNNGEFGTGDKALLAFKSAVGESQAFFEIVKGNYHSMDDHPYLSKVVGWLNTAAMTAALGKATISSMAEVPYTMLGTPHELFLKQLETFAKEFKSELGDDIKKAANFGIGRLYSSWAFSSTDSTLSAKIQKYEDQRTLLDNEYKKLEQSSSNSLKDLDRKIELKEQLDAIDKDVELLALKDRFFVREMMQNLGFRHEISNVQSKFEFNDSRQQNAMAFFASMIGLRAQTDAMRIAVLTVAGDIMMNQVMTLAQVDPNIREVALATGQGLNKAQAAALAELQQYGLNVQALMNAVDAESDQNNIHFFNNAFSERNRDEMNDSTKAVYDNIQTALGNFVDSRVVNPQPYNIPKYYYNPYLRVFTVMTRFMAAAHAVILPRLYKQYLLSNNAGMGYSAFVTMASALLMASVGNALKDQLSYGEESPYVKGKAKRAQRNIHSSGLLGQFERLSDFVSPVYPQSKTKITEQPGKWAYEQAKDKSPTFNYVARTGEGVADVLEGRPEKGAQKLMRSLPVVGSFPIVSRKTVDILNDMKGN